MDPQQSIQDWLQNYGGPSVTPAWILCDRHLTAPDSNAIRYEDDEGTQLSKSFRELHELSSRLAGFLGSQGVQQGDRVAGLLPKGIELVVTTLAVWRLGGVYVPLFTAFGPQGIAYRTDMSRTKVLITDDANRSKLEELSPASRNRMQIVTVSSRRQPDLAGGEHSFWSSLEKASPIVESTPVRGEDPLILIFTSGTTGNPKGVPVPIKGLASFEAYMRFGLDVRKEDVYWNMADPGWAYGLYYNLVGPLLLGKPILFYNASFTPEKAYSFMDRYGVTNFASAPTAYRALKAAGPDLVDRYPPRLRVASSAGEPLNPEVIEWARAHFGIPIHDHYGQTELGMVINNHHHPDLQSELKSGSMGQTMPGFRMVVLDESAQEVAPRTEGQLAVDTQASPLLWFKGYWEDDAKTSQRYTDDGRYCLTGDTVSYEEQGFFFFSGRSDDIILSAGYRIGPFEVESALMEHPSVAETAVIGVPDELRGEIVKAYVVLHSEQEGTEELAEELRMLVKRQLAKHAYPRIIAFVDELPKTPSGKIQRFLLRQKDA